MVPVAMNISGLRAHAPVRASVKSSGTTIALVPKEVTRSLIAALMRSRLLVSRAISLARKSTFEVAA